LLVKENIIIDKTKVRRISQAVKIEFRRWNRARWRLGSRDGGDVEVGSR
jgi:hypothetical protein